MGQVRHGCARHLVCHQGFVECGDVLWFIEVCEECSNLAGILCPVGAEAMAVMVDMHHVEAAIALFEPNGLMVRDEHKATNLLDLLHRLVFVFHHRVFLGDESFDRVSLVSPRWQVELLIDHQLLFEHGRVKA